MLAPCKYSTTVLFNGKIYFFKGLREESTLISEPARRGGGGLFGGRAGGRGGLFGGQGIGGGGGGGGLFAGQSSPQLQPQHAHGFFVLDLGMILAQQLDWIFSENMKWQRTHNHSLLPEHKRCQAEVVGDKIYFSDYSFDEFYVYDPGKHHFLAQNNSNKLTIKFWNLKVSLDKKIGESGLSRTTLSYLELITNLKSLILSNTKTLVCNKSTRFFNNFRSHLSSAWTRKESRISRPIVSKDSTASSHGISLERKAFCWYHFCRPRWRNICS